MPASPPPCGRYLSALHERNIVTLPLRPSNWLRSPPEDFSKFRYNQRREVRLVEEAGGPGAPGRQLRPGRVRRHLS